MRLRLTTASLLFVLGAACAKTLHACPDSTQPRPTYRLDIAPAYGGSAKIGLFMPHVTIVRQHHGGRWRPYYGLLGGVHAYLITGAYVGGGLAGVTCGPLDAEASATYGHYLGVRLEDETTGPFTQTQTHLKLGVSIRRVRLRLTHSWLLNEYVPTGQERPGLFALGWGAGGAWGAEVSVAVRR